MVGDEGHAEERRAHEHTALVPFCDTLGAASIANRGGEQKRSYGVTGITPSAELGT